MQHTPQNICDTQKKLPSHNLVHSLEVTAASAGQVAGGVGRGKNRMLVLLRVTRRN